VENFGTLIVTSAAQTVTVHKSTVTPPADGGDGWSNTVLIAVAVLAIGAAAAVRYLMFVRRP
jgi:hypothetical protein